jgi:adenine-specific DNA-methyltransferase
MTDEGEWVLDPFLGVGTSIIAAIRHSRRGAGAEIVDEYVALAKDRISQELNGTLKTRPMDRPVYDPVKAGNKLTMVPWTSKTSNENMMLFDKTVEGKM